MFTNSAPERKLRKEQDYSSPIMCSTGMTTSPSTFPYSEDGTFSLGFPALNGANPFKLQHIIMIAVQLYVP
ncbi:hypothetical protein NXY05_20600 [Bacteroides fragilis]|nr:hypothetical protein [Bacteroides fragilis]